MLARRRGDRGGRKALSRAGSDLNQKICAIISIIYYSEIVGGTKKIKKKKCYIKKKRFFFLSFPCLLKGWMILHTLEFLNP